VYRQPERTAPRPRPARREKDRRHTELLPLDATVTFAAERSTADIDRVLTALDTELVGLVPVKRRVQEIAALLLVDQARRKFGLSAPWPHLHMCFTAAYELDELVAIGQMGQPHFANARSVRNELDLARPSPAWRPTRPSRRLACWTSGTRCTDRRGW
jgi:hypothetical protein